MALSTFLLARHRRRERPFVLVRLVPVSRHLLLAFALQRHEKLKRGPSRHWFWPLGADYNGRCDDLDAAPLDTRFRRPAAVMTLVQPPHEGLRLSRWRKAAQGLEIVCAR